MRFLPRIPPSATRSRLFLVDDNAQMVERVSRFLSHDFDIAGSTTSGQEAIGKIAELQPDLVILDISMPGMDGFQTIRALEQAGSRVPVVFLSASDAGEDIGEAFRCGARGYVVKRFAARDLPSALDQVLHGRIFVPSLPPLFDHGNDGSHAMQLHSGGEALLDGLAHLFTLALQRGDATALIATEALREGVTHRLRAAGWGLNARWRVIDAAEAARELTRNGSPEESAVAELVAELDQYRREATEGSSGKLTVAGNIVEAMIAMGNDEAALALERHWTNVTRDLPIRTLCLYSASCFDEGPSELWASACHQHSAVSHTSDL